MSKPESTQVFSKLRWRSEEVSVAMKMKPESIKAAAEAHALTFGADFRHEHREIAKHSFRAGVMWERRQAKNLDLVAIIEDVLTDTGYHRADSVILRAKYIADAIQKRSAR